MKHTLIFLLGLALQMFLATGSPLFAQPPVETLLHLTLDKAGKDNNLEVNGGKLLGPLPVGVSQNYLGWQNSVMKTEMVTDEGEPFFRFTVDHVSAGGPQMTISVPELQPGQYYRLTATVRNRADGVFTLYLRENPAPYTMIQPTLQIEPSDQWQTESVFIRFAKPHSGLYSLYFNLNGTGVFDVKEVSISVASAFSYNAQQLGLSAKGSAAIRRPEPTWTNYISGSCFPFGVPAGWNCRRGKAEISEDKSGPSGENALLLSPGFGEVESPRLFSAPFQVPVADKTYTVSFSCKGSGDIFCNGKKFNATDQWQRFDLPLQISSDSAGAWLDFNSPNPFWLDAVRVGPEGEKDYQLAGPSEVILGLPESDASDARVQFHDEPAQMRYRLLGDTANLKLTVSVTNIWGETKEFSLRPESADGQFDYNIFPEVPFGQFRVNVRADRGTEQVAPMAEFVVTRLARPVYWGKDAPNSPFGIHVEPISYMLKGLKAGGLNWVRLHDAGGQYSLWSHAEPTLGKWKFFDDELNNYRNHKMMIYGQLGGAPVWASYYGQGGTVTPSTYWIKFCAPTDEHLPDFEQYAYQMAHHYKGIIDDWCLWNEPWGDFLHQGYDPVSKRYLCFEDQGAKYASILKAAYAGAKRANPNAKISGFGTIGGQDKFTRQVVEAGGFEHCDEIDFHDYAPRVFGHPNDGMKINFDSTFVPLTEKYGPLTKKTIMSEGSPLSNGSDRGKPLQGIYKYLLPWENTDPYHEEADRIVRFVMAYRTCGVKRIFLYTSHGHTNLTQCSFQVLLGGDGYPHPSLAALSALAIHAEDSHFIEYRELCPDVYAAIFAKADGTSFAVVSGRKLQRATVRCTTPNAKGSDLYGNPLAFPLQYEGYLQYITAPCSPEQLVITAEKH